MTPLSESIAELKENERQWEAFNTPGHCAVIAPPGSGKTKLLATRVANDLLTEIPEPHGAACVTLTNAAVAELRERLERLQVEYRSTLFVGTVHSFILSQIIRPFAALYGYDYALLPIASSSQIGAAFKAAIEAHYGPDEDTSNVRSTVERNRKRLAADEDWALSGDVIPQVADSYIETLNASGFTDFDQIIHIAVQLVEQNETVRKVLSSRFPKVYIDEYQDLAPGLDRVVKALCLSEGSSCSLFAVGDPDQAIYGFTGTLPHLLSELAATDGVHPVILNKNYRCGSEIIRYANLLLDDEPDSQFGDEGGSVRVSIAEGEASGQAETICSQIESLAQDGVPLHEIAVLAAWGTDCTEAARVFRNAGIPYFVRTSEYRSTISTIFVESAAAWATQGMEMSDYRLGNLLDRWRLLTGQRWSFESSVRLVEHLMQAEPEGPAGEFVAKLYELGKFEVSSDVSEREDATELRTMLDQLTSGSLTQLTVAGLGDRARKTGRVEITTMTSSKGLEFDVVFIICANQGRIPHYKSAGKPDDLREDRRKFYVSMTRARTRVEIYHSTYAITKYDTVKPTPPSSFLKKMGLA